MNQRRCIKNVAQILGMPSADQDRMKYDAKWTPIFFHSDKVPGFDDDMDCY